MTFLGLDNKTVLVCGLANKKSIAWFVHQGLAEESARVVHVVKTREIADEVRGLVGASPVFVCDVSKPEEIERLARDLTATGLALDGMVHSLAWANYARGVRAFHETERADFLEALDVSCFSLVALARALEPLFTTRASLVTLSISHTHLAAESYGYMAPVKAALDATIVFLAKSLSARGEIRVNSVKAGPLKTSSSAGIPGYLDNYLYAEMATLRHRALATAEVANTVLFLLSQRSSGINAQGLVVDAGMGVNFFDRAIVERATRP
ncbi:MAG TPA: SDR family oxidoreductase [Planctomycetota bacterium]|nr:SDR family oxidoreductase [Planctomycetota bacterium]